MIILRASEAASKVLATPGGLAAERPPVVLFHDLRLPFVAVAPVTNESRTSDRLLRPSFA